MIASIARWSTEAGWSPALPADSASDLVIYFAAPGTMDDSARFDELRAAHPSALLIGCSSGGEIIADEAVDGCIVTTAIDFERTPLRSAEVEIAEGGDSLAAGKALGAALAHADLKAIFVLSDGLRVNGSDLIRGLREAVGDSVTITGGLAGDGADFKETRVGLDHNPVPGRIAAIGLCGEFVRVGHGSIGGWDSFGPERKITRSTANVLYELDGQPVLPLYKNYLGDEAAKLPGSALLFPLTVRPTTDADAAVVRTVLAVDEEANSMTFAGDVPTGWTAQLMRGNFNRLIQGAEEAARLARIDDASVSLLISCIGRKLLLGQRVGDEVEAAFDILGSTQVVGFYSYGEISPHQVTQHCELHNQTMTITTLAEA